MAKKSSKQRSKNSNVFPMLEVGLAAALATAAGYVYVTHKEEIDTAAKKKFKELAKIYKQSKPEIEKRVKQVWGEASKNGVGLYLDLRAKILRELENGDFGAKGVDLKKKYDAIVNSVVAAAKKAGLVTPLIEKKLNEILKMDYKDIEKIVAGALKKGANNAVKAVKSYNAKSRAAKIKKHVMKAASKKAAPKKSSAKGSVKKGKKK